MSIGEDRVVWLDNDVLSQMSLDLGGQLVIFDIELGCGRCDDGIGEEHRIIGDTGES